MHTSNFRTKVRFHVRIYLVTRLSFKSKQVFSIGGAALAAAAVFDCCCSSKSRGEAARSLDVLCQSQTMVELSPLGTRVIGHVISVMNSAR